MLKNELANVEMTGGSNCLRNFNKLITRNYMFYLIKKVFFLIILQNGIKCQQYNLQNLRFVHNYDSNINDKQIIVNEENVWGWKKTWSSGFYVCTSI